MGGPMRLVIADDNPTYRRGLVRAALAEDGVVLLADAEGGAAALEAIRRLRPTAALIDWQMPDLDGPAVCRAVRAEPGGAHIRLVLMTAADEGPLMPAAREAGADELVSKELSRHELLAVARGRPAAGQRRCA